MENKHRMTVEDNIFFAKRNIVDLIYKSVRLEGLAVTYPDTYAVINAGIINGMTLEDATIINNLKHAWQFILDTVDYPMNFGYVCQIHRYVGESLANYNAGFLRNQIIRVTMGDEEPFTPDMLIEADAREEIERLTEIPNETDRAISLMLHLSTGGNRSGESRIGARHGRGDCRVRRAGYRGEDTLQVFPLG
jgi:hypothetical protein